MLPLLSCVVAHRAELFVKAKDDFLLHPSIQQQKQFPRVAGVFAIQLWEQLPFCAVLQASRNEAFLRTGVSGQAVAVSASTLFLDNCVFSARAWHMGGHSQGKALLPQRESHFRFTAPHVSALLGLSWYKK